MTLFSTAYVGHCAVPGKPGAHDVGILRSSYGLLSGIVACLFALLRFPGRILDSRRHKVGT